MGPMRFVRSHQINGAAYPLSCAFKHVSMGHRCPDVCASWQSLTRTNIAPVLEETVCEGMADCYAGMLHSCPRCGGRRVETGGLDSRLRGNDDRGQKR